METEKILISLANPNTIEDMMNLSLVIRDTKLKDNLLALNVINDDSTSDNLRMRSKRYLEKAAMTTTAANVSLKQLTRYDLNIASGIIHSVKENEVTSIITGLHRKVNITDSYFGILTENLLKGLNCEIIISKFLIAVQHIHAFCNKIPVKFQITTVAHDHEIVQFLHDITVLIKTCSNLLSDRLYSLHCNFSTRCQNWCVCCSSCSLMLHSVCLF